MWAMTNLLQVKGISYMYMGAVIFGDWQQPSKAKREVDGREPVFWRARRAFLGKAGV